MSTHVNISKLDAAKRQLETAILIFFNYGDIVSIHTLSAASHQLLMDLGKESGIKSSIKETNLIFIREDKRAEYKQMMNKAENFFKHASKDKDALLKFSPRQSELMLWDACAMYKSLTKEIPPVIYLFDMWFKLSNPEMFLEEDFQKQIYEIRKDIDPTNKGAFLGLLKFINPVKTPE